MPLTPSGRIVDRLGVYVKLLPICLIEEWIGPIIDCEQAFNAIAILKDGVVEISGVCFVVIHAKGLTSRDT